MLDILAIGRAGVDLYSLDYGEPIEEVRRFAKYVGGTAANTVIGGSRLGLKCALVSRVSDDELGSFVVDFLAGEGVDVSHVRKDRRRKTGIVFAEISPGRDGKFVFYRENAGDLFVTKADVPESLIRSTRLLLVTGTGLSKNPSLRTNLHAAALAKRLRKTVVFNLDWRPSLWNVKVPERVRRYRDMMELSDVVIGNRGEYAAAFGLDDADEAVSAVPHGVKKVVVVTSGEKGSEVSWGGANKKAEGFKVPLLKGLGGGDGFIAGFLYGHLKGWKPISAAVFGNAVGAIVVTGHACSESMPRLNRVAGFLRKNGYAFDQVSGPSKR